MGRILISKNNPKDKNKMHKFLYPDQFTEKIREKRANIMCSRARFLTDIMTDIFVEMNLIHFSIKTSEMFGKMRDEFFINPYYQ